jgi:hypothetical protein
MQPQQPMQPLQRSYLAEVCVCVCALQPVPAPQPPVPFQPAAARGSLCCFSPASASHSCTHATASMCALPASPPKLTPLRPPTPLSPSSPSPAQPNMDGEVGTASWILQRRMRSIEDQGRIYDTSSAYLKVRGVRARECALLRGALPSLLCPPLPPLHLLLSAAASSLQRGSARPLPSPFPLAPTRSHTRTPLRLSCHHLLLPSCPSPFLQHRRLLVDWICECGEEHKLANSTAHVAVGLLDKVLQQLDVKRDRYQLVALTCVIIAAKYEEKEEDVPSLRQLTDYVNRLQGAKAAALCDARGVHNMEVLLLNQLQWCLTIVTPLHYLGIFERQVRERERERERGGGARARALCCTSCASAPPTPLSQPLSSPLASARPPHPHHHPSLSLLLSGHDLQL